MKQKLPILLIPLVLILIILTFFLIDKLKPKSAGILVESNVPSTLYINGIRVGVTPYTGAQNSGSVILKLIPQDSSQGFTSYETKTNLAAGIKTVVRRNFSKNPLESSSEVISFERTDLPDASISVVSLPDSAQVSVDGLLRGFTPLKITSLTTGAHQLSIAASGYQTRDIQIKTLANYRLTAIVQLGSTAQVSGAMAVATPTPVAVPMIEILKTPTGFLRVRSEPQTASNEVGQVHPGEKYKLLTTDKVTGWFMIDLGENKGGWISNQYATVTPP